MIGNKLKRHGKSLFSLQIGLHLSHCFTSLAHCDMALSASTTLLSIPKLQSSAKSQFGVVLQQELKKELVKAKNEEGGRTCDGWACGDRRSAVGVHVV